MESLDVRGLSCPMPVLKCKKAIDSGAKEILIVGSSEVSKENIIKLAKSQGFNINITKDKKDLWEIEIKK